MSRSCVVVVPFVRLNSYVRETLTHCLKLEYSDVRIVLLPDGPIALPLDLQRDNVSVIVTGDCTISRKRNLAIDHFSDADYFAFIDSDAYPEKDWLKNGVDFLECNPDTWAVGGPNITPNDEPFLQRVVGNALMSFLVSGPLAFAKARTRSRRYGRLHSCNLIVPRTAFIALGGFEETLFTGEDRNLCDRICAAGKAIWFRTDVVVYHHARSLWLPFFCQRLVYGYCSMAIILKRMSRANTMLLLPLLWLLLFCALAVTEITTTGEMRYFTFLNLACLACASFEAIRTSGSIKEMPLTLAAIVLNYLAVTSGQILSLTGRTLALKSVYVQQSRTEEILP